MTIDQLNERRALAEMRMKALGMQNLPTDAESQLKATAQYRLAYDAWFAAQKEYQDAMNRLSADARPAMPMFYLNSPTPPPSSRGRSERASNLAFATNYQNIAVCCGK